MTDPRQLEAEKARRAKLLFDIGAFVGMGFFIFGLYLIKPYLAPLIGGLLVAAASFFAGYDQVRRGDR